MAGFPGKDEHYLGITHDDIAQVEPKLGKKHKLTRHFKPLTTLLASDVNAALDRGSLPIVSFKPRWGWHGSKVSHQHVRDGEIDGFLRDQRDAFVRDGRDVVLCYTPEPETRDEAEDFGGGIPREQLGPMYGEAFSHILDVFGEHENIRWVVAFAGGMIQYDWVQRYWPNDARIEYVGSDPYNWCPTSGHGAGLESFHDTVKDTLEFAKVVQRPVLLLEAASWYKVDDPSFRANWITQMGQTLTERPRIKGVCWFNNLVECDFRLEPQAASISAWGDLLTKFGHL